MGAEKNIVAIELGSSSIRGMLGQRRANGSLHVLGFEKEPVTDWIHKGVVFNFDKTAQAVTAIVKRLEERHKVYVKKAYVGVSGQSLRTIGNKATKQFDVKVVITDDIIDSLRDDNGTRFYPDSEILDVLPQEYIVNGRSTNEPVGTQTDRIEGLYKNVVARTTLCEGIRRCMHNAKIDVAEMCISPLFLAGYLLTDNEKRSGCAMVDFGAETTTVAIYDKNILRHLVVIPLGGNNITADIASVLHLEFDEAEKLKRSYGKAFTNESEPEDSTLIELSGERTIELAKLQDIIIGRQQEILTNVWNQLKNYSDRLLNGVVLTGGAANMDGMETAFTRLSEFDKRVVVRLMPATIGYDSSLKLDPTTITLATLVAMLRRGEQECTSEKPAEPELFKDDVEQEQDNKDTTTTGTGSSEGVVKPVKPVTVDTTTTTDQTDTATTGGAVDNSVIDDDTDTDPQPKKPGFLSKLWNKFGEMVTEVTDPNK